jgi:arylsulfatase A-like enzyme
VHSRRIDLRAACFVAAAWAVFVYVWHLFAAAGRLFTAAAEHTQFGSSGFISGALSIELRLLSATLLGGCLTALLGFLMLRAIASKPGDKPASRTWLAAACISTLVLLVAAREMAYMPALFEAWASSARWSGRLLSFIADDVGFPTFQWAVWGVLALAAIGCGREAWHVLRTALPSPRARGLVSGLSCLLLSAVWLAPPARSNTGPNLLILAADSLTAAHLSSSGYGRATTPHLDELARHSITLTNLHVPLARTLPSWTTMLTGLMPAEHGVTTMFPAPGARQLAVPSVPRSFARAGYYTSVVSDYAGDFFSLIDYGFETKRVPPAMSAQLIMERESITATPLLLALLNSTFGRTLLPVLRFLPNNADPSLLTREVLEEIDRGSQSEHFFVTAFYSVTHMPYAAPYPYFRRYTRPSYAGTSKYSYVLRSLSDLKRLDQALTPADFEQTVALYDGALRAFDDNVGVVLDHLKRRDLWKNTLVVVLGDHGEVLRPRQGGVEHGNLLSDGDDLQIPCILRSPFFTRPGSKLGTLLSTVDLGATLLELTGQPAVSAIPGTPILDRTGRDISGGPRLVYHETGEWLAAEKVVADPHALSYPNVDELLETDTTGNLTIRPSYRRLVEIAKHRAVRDDDFMLLYRPYKDGGQLDLLALTPAGIALQKRNDASVPARRARLVDELKRQIGLLPGAHLSVKTRLIEFQFDD